MGTKIAIDLDQQEVQTPGQKRREAIIDICEKMKKSSQTFDQQATYEAVKKYKEDFFRWQYSYISQYIFRLAPEDQDLFVSNLDALVNYAEEKECKENDRTDELVVLVDKLWDHSNLAYRQALAMRQDHEMIVKRFEEYTAPLKAQLTHEMNVQQISLIAIFTTLSFLVFGGLNSLDNIFSGAMTIPIIKLAIIGSIWSLCVLNLVFIFVFFISKLTKLSISAISDENASVSQKYPFWIWSNFFILLTLSGFSWLYYIDYSNSGSWLIRFSQQNPVCSSIIGTSLITILFFIAAKLIMKQGSKTK